MKCGHCGAETPEDSAFCPFCGEKQAMPESEAPLLAQESEEAPAVPDSEAAPQTQEGEIPPSVPVGGRSRVYGDLEKKQKPGKAGVIIFIVLAVVCVALIVGAVFAIKTYITEDRPNRESDIFAQTADDTQVSPDNSESDASSAETPDGDTEIDLNFSLEDLTTAEILYSADTVTFLGNTPANGASGGSMVEYNGVCYYLSAAGISKVLRGGTYDTVADDTNAWGLNIYKGKIYCLSDNNICSMNLDGTDRRVLCMEKCDDLIVKDDWIYYTSLQSAVESDYWIGQICRMRLNGTDKQQLTSDLESSFIVAGDSIVYCNESDNYNLYRCDLDGENPVLISTDICVDLSYDDGWLYYNSGDYDWRLCRCDLDGENVSVIIDQPLYDVNVWNGVAYYIDDIQTGVYYQIIDTGETGCFDLGAYWIVCAGKEQVFAVSEENNIYFYDAPQH